MRPIEELVGFLPHDVQESISDNGWDANEISKEVSEFIYGLHNEIAELQKLNERMLPVLTKVNTAVMKLRDEEVDLKWVYQGSNLGDFKYGMHLGRTDLANALALTLLEKDDV